MERETHIPAHFFRQAWREALRYGDDDWVFVRELIQNARDARATEIRLDVETSENLESLTCRDDGIGMDATTIRDHLTRLFSSTKNDGADGAIGRFGVGFWSVLRFRPSEIVVDSVHESGRHALRIDVVHRVATAIAPERTARGTTITLLRSRGSEEPHALVDVLRARVRHYAGPVTGLANERPPALVVGGLRVNEDMRAGGLVHRPLAGRGYHGTIALSSVPSIRLYARGLLVREAMSLEELLPRAGTRARESIPGLHVSSSVNADDLEVLLDRQHVVESPTLERIVDGIDKSAARLLKDVLERLAPLPPLGRVKAALRRKETAVGGALVVMLVIAGVVGVELSDALLSRHPTVSAPNESGVRPIGTDTSHVESPRIDTESDPSMAPWAFRYEGPDGLLFRVGTLAVFDARGGLVRSPLDEVRTYRFASARADDDARSADAREVAVVTTAEGPEALVLPVPPAHRVVAKSVTIDGTHVDEVGETVHGEPLLHLPPGSHAVTYKTRVDTRHLRPSRDALSILSTTTDTLPEAFAPLVERARTLDVDARIEVLKEAVRQHVRYTTDPLDATLFSRSTLPFLERVARFGAGDCDVQNGTLTLLLRSAGLPARLAVGLVGERGRVARDFHAWAEVFDGETWRVLDVAPVRPRVDGALAVAARASPPIESTPPSLERGPARPSSTSPTASGRGDRAPAIASSTETPSVVADSEPTLPTNAVAPTTSAFPRDALQRWRVPASFAVVALGAGFFLLALWRRRRLKIDDDVAARMTEALLARVATAPADPRDTLSLRRRRLLPTLRSRRASLFDVDSALAAGRACVALRGTVPPLSLPKDVLLLDGSTPIVRRLIATLPGLVDLDAVARALDDTPTPVCDKLERALRRHAPGLRVLLVDGVSTGVLSAHSSRRPTLTAIGRDAPAVRRALDESSVDIAAFLLAEHLFSRTPAFFDVRDDVLAQLAREVLP